MREAVAWLDRTLPLSARFPKGEIFREDQLPVPADALREVLLNAVMHRDYSNPSGYVAAAVFDDRIEVHSIGALPRGVTAAELSGPHMSIPRNPLIAEIFHRTGAVEIWGRGTNRVIEACRRHGIEPSPDDRGGVSGTPTTTFASRSKSCFHPLMIGAVCRAFVEGRQLGNLALGFHPLMIGAVCRARRTNQNEWSLKKVSIP